MTVTEGFISKQELAQQLGRCTRTLDRMERLRIGPPRVKVGKLILYRVDAVRDWLASQEQQHSRPRSAR